MADLLAGLFEAHGFRVEVCRTDGAAERRLATARVDLVVTPWDREIGKQIYRWATARSHGMQRRFVFVVDEVPASLKNAAARRRVAPLTHVEAVLDAVMTTARRLRREEEVPLAQGTPAPRVLVVDDDPDQLAAIADLLRASGYIVSAAGGVGAAVAALESSSVDAILSDYHMGDGTGAELCAWVREHQPHFLGAVVLITGGNVDEARAAAGPVLVLPKGQDSRELITALIHAVAIGRGAQPHDH
ncbi:MAG TPA: response regulator [Kofleriaceae bacterium]|nr:response regulator [Kofleriaceae bacterium]